ncbi:MAG: DUF3467 domain-containing protein [Thermoleophilia bacterium]
MSDDAPEPQLTIHLDPEHMAGAYANFAKIAFSDYEFTLTFARIDHEGEDGTAPNGIVVSRVNLSPLAARELLEALQSAWSSYELREGIRGLPERRD